MAMLIARASVASLAKLFLPAIPVDAFYCTVPVRLITQVIVARSSKLVELTILRRLVVLAALTPTREQRRKKRRERGK